MRDQVGGIDGDGTAAKEGPRCFRIELPLACAGDVGGRARGGRMIGHGCSGDHTPLQRYGLQAVARTETLQLTRLNLQV
jgi:hypothetical protein